jgi:glutamate-1-semialdehyde 2,1-aminomutase
VPFNDLESVEAALARGDVACVLTEPALTNCGLVPPRPGFLAGVQAACRRHGTLLVLDETHTVSTALGGAGRAWGLTPDAIVVGKAVAGGVPCAAYGFSADFARAAAAAKSAAPDGHSGIGTTLAGSLLALAALEAVLDHVMTPDAYLRMDALAGRLAASLQGVVDRRRLPWCVARLGARLELQFCADVPLDAAASRRAQAPALAAALQLYLLNRGLLLTPFHLMWLLAPCADVTDVDAVAPALEAFLDDVA